MEKIENETLQYPPRILEVVQPRFGSLDNIYIFNEKYMKALLTKEETFTSTLPEDLFVKSTQPKSIAIIQDEVGCVNVYCCSVPYQLGYTNHWRDSAGKWHSELEKGLKDPIAYPTRDDHPNERVHQLAFDWSSKYLKRGAINGYGADWFQWEEPDEKADTALRLSKIKYVVYSIDGTRLEPAPRSGICYECMFGLHELSTLRQEAGRIHSQLALVNSELERLQFLQKQKESLIGLSLMLEGKIDAQKRMAEYLKKQ